MSTSAIPPNRNAECENLLDNKIFKHPDKEFKSIAKETLFSLRDAHAEGTLSDILFVRLICYFPTLVKGKEEEFKRSVEVLRGSADTALKPKVAEIDRLIDQKDLLRRLYVRNPLLCDEPPLGKH